MDNRNNKKNFNNNNKQRKPAPKVYSITYAMDMSGVNGDKQYDPETLAELLKTIPWQSISYPVNAAKSIIFGDESKVGTTSVGYVTGVEVKKGEDDLSEVFIGCVIHTKNVDAISKLKNPYIYPKVRTDRDGEVKILISFEIKDDDVEE